MAEENKGIVDPTKTIEATEPTTIADGLHNGKIVRVEYRDEPYAYCDIILSIEGVEKVELKAGYPQVVSPNSGLGQLLEKFGADISKGKQLNPYEILVGKEVVFQTITETVKREDGGISKFARVVRESLKPKE